jgi:predicted nucleic acid-binding protein
MKFWDSSAIVPLLVDQLASNIVEGIAKADPVMTVWWGTAVECVSAISRLERMERKLSLSQSAVALGLLDDLSANWIEIGATESVRERAQRLLRVHDLRAGDAFQLAAAITACEEFSSSHEFICLDARLANAAMREGFRVVGLPPDLP